MKKIIKIISLLLCVPLLLAVFFACDSNTAEGDTTTAGTTLSTTAGTTAATTKKPKPKPEPEPEPTYEIREFADKLISNWDFKGETAEEMLLDKATAGSSSEKIVLTGNEASVISGSLKVQDSVGSYASIDCPSGSDLYDLANKTLVMKVRMTNVGESGGVAAILSKKTGYDFQFSGATDNRKSTFRYVISGTRTALDASTATAVDEWRIHAVSVEYNEEAKQAIIMVYKSKVENPTSYKDFEIVANVKVNDVSKGFMQGSDKIYLGKRYSHLSENRGLNSEFAGIKVYDMALNVAEVATIRFDIDFDTVFGELTQLIAQGDAITRTVQSDSEWSAFTAALIDAKKLTKASSVEDVQAAIKKLRTNINIVTIKKVPNAVGIYTMLPYNNPDADVWIDGGAGSVPIACDIDNDGDLDLVISATEATYGGISAGAVTLHRNTSNVKGTTHLSGAELLGNNVGEPIMSSKLDGSLVYVSGDGTMYTELTREGFGNPVTFSKLKDKAFKLYDIDGDGKSDAVFAAGTINGEKTDYDSQGNNLQTRTSTIKWIKNTGTEENPDFSGSINNVRNRNATTFTVAGKGNGQYTFITGFSMHDWDGDGDLDLIAGGWMNEYYYYENQGSAKSPVFDNEGVLVQTVSGSLALPGIRYQLINCDWDGDGYEDLIIGAESGKIAYLRCSDKRDPNTGAPIFEDVVYFTQDAEYIAIGSLSRPTACDWDGDGDDDFIVGDNGGYLWLIENLTGGSNPSWAAPVKLKDENGNILVIKAGLNGSLQGTQEAEWGYTVPCAADWDGDGDIDIIVNSVTGRIQWFENIGTATAGQLTQPKAVEVEWENGNLYPSWQWWTPEGKELVTQHRTTPYLIDWNQDGLCDLIMLDHEGYLAYYERYEEGGVLKLKQGQRVFMDSSGAPIRLQTGTVGTSGRIKFVITDWNCDGVLDLITDGESFVYYKGVKTESGKFCFVSQGTIGFGNLRGHNHGFTVVDWDEDGDPDIVTGTQSGYFYYFENTTKNPVK